jgi:2-methylcitrate dehydratase PrpD
MGKDGLTRRRVLKTAGGLVAAVGVPVRTATGQSDTRSGPGDITGRLARYMVAARDQNLPPEVVREAKHRILDTLGAIVSGARMKPGEAAIAFMRTQGGTREASVMTTNIRTTAINAALANGMFGHADETDDFEPITKAHPGCAVVPAAFAIAEREGRSGTELLRAVVLGYDLCCRFLMALGPDHVRGTHRSAEGTSATFGAVGAAASLARLNEEQMRYALSYAAQQVSGLWSWVRDNEHIEKAFDFGGMGARNGVTAALMVQSGFTGVREVLDGEHNMIEALSTEPKPEQMVADLGTRFWVTDTAIKTFSVGYPIQAPLDALLTLRRQHGLTADNVDRVVARLPADGAGVVNGRSMPDVNIYYVLAVGLLDGTVSFADSHSFEKMKEPRVTAVMKRIELVADRSLMDPAAPRSGLVEITLRDGRKVNHFTRHAPGTKENPVSTDTINEKVRDLMVPVIGAQRAEEVIRRVHAIEQVKNVRDFVRSVLAEG